MTLGNYIHAMLDIFYPRFCFNCNRGLNDSHERYICNPCKTLIPYIEEPYCIRCGASLGPYVLHSDEGCPACKDKKFRFDTLTCMARYDGVIKSLIRKIKYHKQKFLSRVFNEILSTSRDWKENSSSVDVIVPVPLYWMKKIQRGFNQSELLSRAVQEQISKPVSKNNLYRAKNTLPQTRLPKSQRMVNVRGAFCVRYPGFFEKKAVLLVDDVLTTGTTAFECSKKLKEAGARAVHVFVLAANK